jgi:dihydroorotase
MIHHVNSSVPLETVLTALRPGDILTHIYHPRPDHGFGPDGAPLPVMRQARERGVVLDVGHGVGSFAWSVAEPACRQYGFWPDTISTDIHRFNLHGPVFDLPTTMSKFLYLGLSPAEVIRAATSAPARAMGLQDQFGSLVAGRAADITLLRLEAGRFPLADVRGEVRVADRRLTAIAVFKRGAYRECRRHAGPEE